MFGSQSMERLIKECDLGQALKARFYRGEAGATVAYWYSVTVQSSEFKERQIFYTYSEPEITSIECSASSLNVVLDKYPKQVFDLEAISSLKEHPKGFLRGKEVTH